MGKEISHAYRKRNFGVKICNVDLELKGDDRRGISLNFVQKAATDMNGNLSLVRLDLIIKEH